MSTGESQASFPHPSIQACSKPFTWYPGGPACWTVPSTHCSGTLQGFCPWTGVLGRSLGSQVVEGTSVL